MEVERTCETCDNYLGAHDPEVCAVKGCDPATLSMYTNVGYLQTLEASDEGTIQKGFKTASLPQQTGESGGGGSEQGADSGQILRVPRATSPTDEEAVPEGSEDEVSAPSNESLSKQRCLAKTKKGEGPQCKRDALPGELFCGAASHKKQVIQMIEDGNID